jgi:ribose 1,5-bisphosphokinase PhnN
MRVLVTAMVVLLGPSFSSADSLGSAARKQAQRRDKPRVAEARVFSDADLAARPSAPAEESASSAEPTSTQAAPSGATAAQRSTDEDQLRRELEREERARRQQETYWRQAAAACRGRVADAKQAYDYVCAGGTRLTGG